MDFDFYSIPGEFGEGLRAAKVRIDQRVAEIGQDAYDAEREQRRANEMLEFERQARVGRARRIIENSGLGKKYLDFTFGDFPVNPNNEKAYKSCFDMARQKAPYTRGVVLTGPNGIGKTRLAACIINAVAQRGHVVYFGNIVDIKNRVYDSFGDMASTVKRILECDLLVIDDLGQEYVKDPDEDNYIRELVYQLVNKLDAENRGIVITTNLDPKAFAARYKQATLSRLMGMCNMVRFVDKDHRIEG